ncbi:MAG: PEGA domain-containing protein [Spirochaetales bacterium]|nr:PEGA domain-containing protein [Spirochaetales bacterium]
MSKKSLNIVIITVLLFIFNILPLFSDDDIVFRIGICRFENTGENTASIADGVTSSFYETIKSISEHRMNSEEIRNYLADGKDEEIRSKKKSIEKLYLDRDKIIFTTDQASIDEKIEAKELAISNAKEDLEELDREKWTAIANVDDDAFSLIPVELKSPENSLYYERSAGEISDTLKENSLDAVIYGYVEKINDYTYIEIRMWNNFLKKDTVSWRTAVNTDDVNKLIAPGRTLVKTAILSHAWAELSVFGPDNCAIYVNDDFSGVGKLNKLIIEPGEVAVEVKKPGHESYKTKITIVEYEDKKIEVDLPLLSKREMVIQSFPAGADVYVDSKWVGKSPVRIETEDEITAVNLKLEGYQNNVFFVDSEAPHILNVNMKKITKVREDIIPAKRRAFLTSFGSTILSIPVSLFLYSMKEQTKDVFNNEQSENGTENYEELLRLRNNYYTEYSLMVCSIGLNVFLFSDMVVKAVDYVDSVEYFSK